MPLKGNRPRVRLDPRGRGVIRSPQSVRLACGARLGAFRPKQHRPKCDGINCIGFDSHEKRVFALFSWLKPALSKKLILDSLIFAMKPLGPRLLSDEIRDDCRAIDDKERVQQSGPENVA